MKTIIAILMVMFCINLNATIKHNSPSWKIYCEKYNVNPEEPTTAQVNTYLDCYVGSVEEEEDLDAMKPEKFFWMKMKEISSCAGEYRALMSDGEIRPITKATFDYLYTTPWDKVRNAYWIYKDGEWDLTLL